MRGASAGGAARGACLACEAVVSRARRRASFLRHLRSTALPRDFSPSRHDSAPMAEKNCFRSKLTERRSRKDVSNGLLPAHNGLASEARSTGATPSLLPQKIFVWQSSTVTVFLRTTVKTSSTLTLDSRPSPGLFSFYFFYFWWGFNSF